MKWKQLLLIGVLIAAILLLIYLAYLLSGDPPEEPEEYQNFIPIRQENHRYYPELNIDWRFEYPVGGVELEPVADAPTTPRPAVPVPVQPRPRRRRRFQQIIILQDNPETALEMVREVARQEHHEAFQHDLEVSEQPSIKIASKKPKRRDKRREKADDFYNKMTTAKTDHKNDKQNVHDVNIRKCLTNKLLRVVELNSDTKDKNTDHEIDGVKLSQEEWLSAKNAQIRHEIQQKANEYFARTCKPEEAELKSSRIELVLDKIGHGYTITMKDYKQYRETYILNHIWDRINHKDNFAKREQLQIALIDNLLDATHKKGTLAAVANNIINAFMGGAPPIQPSDIRATWTTHCINGRVGRVITSLTLLDADEKLAAPEMDDKELANEAYMKAEKILDLALAEYPTLPDVVVKLKDQNIKRTIPDLYAEWDEEKLTTVEKQAVAAFEDYARDQIRKTLTSDYEGLFQYKKLDEIIEKAQAGV